MSLSAWHTVLTEHTGRFSWKSMLVFFIHCVILRKYFNDWSTTSRDEWVQCCVNCVALYSPMTYSVGQKGDNTCGHHGMINLSVLLALCERNPSVIGWFHKGPVMRSFCVSFVVCISNLLNKQSSWYQFDKPCRSYWTWLRHQIETFSALLQGPLCGEFTGHRWIPLTKASDVELWCFLWSTPEQTVE